MEVQGRLFLAYFCFVSRLLGFSKGLWLAVDVLRRIVCIVNNIYIDGLFLRSRRTALVLATEK